MTDKHKEALEALEDLLHEAQTQGVWSSLNVSRAETIRQALQAASWQSIETAPRDGTEFMAIIQGCDSGNYRIISPCKFINDGFTFDGSEISNAWTEKFWQPSPPLPAAPVDGGETTETPEGK